jgi:aminoglycoside 3-N-acetyltransferase
MSTPVTTEQEIVDGLRALGLDGLSTVIVHSSLRSFGYVDGGALAVCRALVAACGTVLMPAGAWDRTGVPAPPNLIRPHNAVHVAESWDEFDVALEQAVPFSPDLPIDRELGRVPETMRQSFPHQRCTHPLLSFLAVGRHAAGLIAAQTLDRPLDPIEALASLDGDVLLLGVDHTVNTAIHLAEQRLRRSRFYRYAKAADGVWMELPNIPGQSHCFGEIEPELTAQSCEVIIGRCRARRVAVATVLAAAERLILADPAAMLCPDPECRCGAALQQRLAWLAAGPGDREVVDAARQGSCSPFASARRRV